MANTVDDLRAALAKARNELTSEIEAIRANKAKENERLLQLKTQLDALPVEKTRRVRKDLTLDVDTASFAMPADHA
jgi:phosphoribosylaminoimidazole carboxylase (NCAIR synthetase)